MAQDEEAMLKGAIAATQTEIFDAAWDKEESVLDESGDKSREEMGEGLEGEHEPEEEAELEAEGAENGAEGDGKAKPEGEQEPARDDKGKFAKDGKAEPEKVVEPDPKTGKDHRVPVRELTSEREKRQAAEAETARLKSELEANKKTSGDEVAKLNAKLDGILAAQRQQPLPKAEQPKKDEPPDMFADPEGYRAWQQRQVAAAVGETRRELTERFIDSSFGLARDADEATFDKAYAALRTLDPRNPLDVATVRNITNAPNPGSALMKWHRQQEALREVGTDPGKYREKVAADTREALMKDPEFRKQVIAELKAEAEGASDGRPRTITRLPKSLNGASGSGAAHDAPLDGSQGGIFESVWSD